MVQVTWTYICRVKNISHWLGDEKGVLPSDWLWRYLWTNPIMYQSHIPQCTISVTKWCIVGHLFDALWDLWEGCMQGDCARVSIQYIPVNIQWTPDSFQFYSPLYNILENRPPISCPWALHMGDLLQVQTVAMGKFCHSALCFFSLNVHLSIFYIFMLVLHWNSCKHKGNQIWMM